MILYDLPPGTTVSRTHPAVGKSAHQRAGAASKGGRFNREGVAALYLSLDGVSAERCRGRKPHRGQIRTSQWKRAATCGPDQLSIAVAHHNALGIFPIFRVLANATVLLDLIALETS